MDLCRIGLCVAETPHRHIHLQVTPHKQALSFISADVLMSRDGPNPISKSCPVWPGWRDLSQSGIESDRGSSIEGGEIGRNVLKSMTSSTSFSNVSMGRATPNAACQSKVFERVHL